MEQQKKKIYLLCRLDYDFNAIYGIFTDKHLLAENYYKVLKEEQVHKEFSIAIYEFEENALAGEFHDYIGDDTQTFYERYKKIGIEEVEADD